jgi:redox-sensitive bicupin YhaK (pirin superfamily)
MLAEARDKESIMSYFSAAPSPCNQCEGAVELLIEPRLTDLGEFSVRRALPARDRRRVGPFVFFDHMGPATFPPGRSIDVRPHPHIGIATITYLFEGEILHRDSLGCVQPIQPGAVNLMVAGRGIVHSERPGADVDETSRLHGIQSWIALPDGDEEREPAFRHYPAEALPEITGDGSRVRVIMGRYGDLLSPVTTFSTTLYLDVSLDDRAVLPLPLAPAERAVYVAEGSVDCGRQRLDTGTMAVLSEGQPAGLQAREAARVLVIGGDAIGERHLYWNFVSSSRARIEDAKAAWRDGGFPRIEGDSEEFIPLPD